MENAQKSFEPTVESRETCPLCHIFSSTLFRVRTVKVLVLIPFLMRVEFSMQVLKNLIVTDY